MKEKEHPSNKEFQKKDSTKQKTSLKDFVDQNSKLISILGVFSALTVFVQEIVKKPIGELFGYVLSFLFLSLSIIILFELMSKAKVKSPSARLRFFKYILQLAIVGILFYWLLSYRTIWRVVMPFVVYGIILWLFSFIIMNFKVLKKLDNTNSIKLRILKIIIGLGILYIVIFVIPNFITPIAEIINNGLDEMKDGLERLYESIASFNPVTG